MPRKETATTKAQRELRRDRVLTLVRDGATLRQAADQLGISAATAMRDVRTRLDEAAKNCPATGQYRELHRQRYSRLLVVWMPRAVGRPARTLEDGTEVPALEPDPLALDRVLRILEREARLLGLDRPVRIKHGGKVKTEPQGLDLDDLSDDDLRDLDQMLDNIRQQEDQPDGSP